MPVISMFLGIIIKMFWYNTGQHKQPHFHAYYAEYDAVFSLEGELLTGDLPPKQHAYVRAWALMHSEELLANWQLLVNGDEAFKIDPLR